MTLFSGIIIIPVHSCWIAWYRCLAASICSLLSCINKLIEHFYGQLKTRWWMDPLFRPSFVTAWIITGGYMGIHTAQTNICVHLQWLYISPSLHLCIHIHMSMCSATWHTVITAVIDQNWIKLGPSLAVYGLIWPTYWPCIWLTCTHTHTHSTKHRFVFNTATN